MGEAGILPVNLPTHGFLPDALNGFAGPLGTHFDRNLPLPGGGPGTFAEFFGGRFAPPSNGVPSVALGCAARWFPGFGGGQICRFADGDFAPGAPYHFEVEIFGPTPAFNVFIFTPLGVGGGTLRPIPAGVSVLLEAQFPEFPFLETGLPFTWAFSTLPFGIFATWSITENPPDPFTAPAPPFALFPCPLGGAFCGGIGDDPWAEVQDPSLPAFFGLRPEDFDRLRSAIPAPVSLLMLSVGLAGLGFAARPRRGARSGAGAEPAERAA